MSMKTQPPKPASEPGGFYVQGLHGLANWKGECLQSILFIVTAGQSVYLDHAQWVPYGCPSPNWS